MKLLAPVSDPEEVEMLVAAGADELYCGVQPADWQRRFGGLNWANRRMPGRANLTSVESLGELVESAHRLGSKVHLALNAPHYEAGMYDALLTLARGAAECRVDAFIVADLGMLLRIRQEGLPQPVHLSSLGRVFNQEDVRFFVDLGVSRIMLSRQFTLEEIARFVREVPEVEFEAFILNDGCVYEESMCMSTHALGAFCFTDWTPTQVADARQEESQTLSAEEMKAHLEDYNRWRWNLNNAGCSYNEQQLPNGPCGLCALATLRNMGVASVKIVGREAAGYRKLRSVQMVKAVLRRISEGALDDEITRFSREIRDTADLCGAGYMCYYRRDP